MAVDRHLSECLAMMERTFARYARDGLAVHPEACTEISVLFGSFRVQAFELENAKVERDELRAVACDLDLLNAEKLPPIDLMRLVVNRCIEDAGGNVVIFPGSRRRHASSPTTGGAA